MSQLISRFQQLIAAPSISSALAEYDSSNKTVIDLLAEWLTPLGFDCEIMPVPKERIGEADKFNLIATLGSGPGGLVLSGHTDTVPCNPERWNSDPFTLTERDGKLYGLGTCDMKGFFALTIEAIEQILQQLGNPRQPTLQQPLIILATADEESSMSGARALVEQGKPKGRYAIIGEPTGLKPIRMHKGIMMETIRLIGNAGHSSNPGLGINAIDAMCDVMTELKTYRQQLAAEHRNQNFEIEVPTLNLGCLHGGDNPNRICGSCELAFDLRALPGMSNEQLRHEMEERIKPIAQRHKVEFTLKSLFPGVPSFATDKNARLIQLAEKLTHHQAQAVAFATEAPFMQQLGMETVVLGPGSIDQAHQLDEFISLDQIQPTVELLTQFINTFCFEKTSTT
ncbi:MAG: acetylornithine deacetylase [Oleispira sp.]|nr:acetylornithine deacetylase [Oleispira sp.]